jgi:TRAP-type mannitol/chloroaromatic compound transport system permease small subunit
LAVVVYFGWPLVEESWRFNEHSESANGLPYRWVIKSILLLGLFLVVIAVLSVVMRLVAFLFGNIDVRHARINLGHSVSEV